MRNGLRFLREKRGWTQDQAADALGMSKGGYLKLERGENDLTTSRIEIAAKGFGVSTAEIITSTLVNVVGRIGAGGAIDTEWEQQTEPLFEVEIPFPLSDDAVGFEISGISMWPRYDDGDVIVVRRSGEPLEELINQEAAIRLRNGGRYFKRIVPTAVRGLFDLESYNAPTIRNVEIEWASGLIASVPAARWRRLNGKPPAKPKEDIAAETATDQPEIDSDSSVLGGLILLILVLAAAASMLIYLWPSTTPVEPLPSATATPVAPPSPAVRPPPHQKKSSPNRG